MKFIQAICLSLALVAGVPSIKVQAQNGTGYFLHTVTKGQSLYSIASMYNVTVDDIVRMNPNSREQIRAGQALKIPQHSNNNQKEQFHTIQAGETLYKLTVKYNVTSQEICQANPGLSASNFRIGQVIAIPTSSGDKQEVMAPKKEETPAQQEKWRDMHKVQRKETIFSISREYGLTEEELIAANPELRVKKLKKGTFLFIPYPQKEQPAAASKPVADVQAPSNEELFRKNEITHKKYATIRAAVMLPFSKSSSRNDEQSRMVEFYEGFLMAVDSLKHQGISLDIYTYDTKGTAAGLQSVLSQNNLKGMDIIFGPVNQEEIPVLAEFAKKNKVRLVIPFSPKVNQVFNNPYVYQVNTPQSYLYSEVYEHYIRKFGKTNVVFVDDGSQAADKLDFIKGMKTELKDKGVPFKQIQLGVELDPVRVIAAMDTLKENIFIPISGKSSTLTKVLPHLTQVRREHPNFNMHLFGYPEWQTYTQDFLASFYELDTYFYSSFYTNNLFPAAISFTQSYRRWFSKDMANTFPKYGMLGFDIGYFFLKGLAMHGSDMEEKLHRVQVTPIQTGFKFERVNNWGGFINRKVFFVHFAKDFELIKLDFE